MSRRQGKGDYRGGSILVSPSGAAFAPLASRWDFDVLGPSGEGEFVVHIDEETKGARIHTTNCRYWRQAIEKDAVRFYSRLGRTGWSIGHTGAGNTFKFVERYLAKFEVTACQSCRPSVLSAVPTARTSG